MKLKRRHVLALLLAAGALHASHGVCDVPVYGWRRRRVFVMEDGEPRWLDVALAEGVAPAATRRGLWLATDDGALERWSAEHGQGWHRAERHALGASAHALAASPDGRHAAAAHGQALSIVESGAGVLRRLEGRQLGGAAQARASAVFSLPQRRSFVVAWPALRELWELALDPQAAPVFDGLVHDYRMGEAIASPGFLHPRRTRLDAAFPDLRRADWRVPWLAGTVSDGVAIVHLDVRRQIAMLPCRVPRPELAALHADGGALRWWLPVDGRRVLVVDPQRWRVVAEHELPAPVNGLHVVGGEVWAQVAVEEGAATGVMRWRDGEWEPLPRLHATVHALVAEAAGDRAVAVMSGEPGALHVLNAEGGVEQRCPWPDVSAGLGCLG